MAHTHKGEDRRGPRRLLRWRPASSDHVDGLLAETDARIDGLHRSIDGVGRALDEVRAELGGLIRRLERTQALVARTYERQEEWPQRLAALRASPGYPDAFDGEPLVSVRIPTLGRPELLFDRALDSVRAQTYERWEALVVGDGCDEATTRDIEERLSALGDSRIKFWNLPVRGPYPGGSHDRWHVAGVPPGNAAIDEARGGWIAPLDDDDAFDEDHIEVLLRAAQCERAELVYGRMRVVLEDSDARTEFGTWPPAFTEFGLQACLYHGGLKDFQQDANAWLADEPADWNLARRMWEAGVRFSFLDRIVGTYYVPETHMHRAAWEQRAAEKPAG
jgi:Glycosyl transferase family 2